MDECHPDVRGIAETWSTDSFLTIFCKLSVILVFKIQGEDKKNLEDHP